MAEFDDIEYEGIGEDRHIAIGSADRCFRDHSPGDAVVSLGDDDDGQTLYSRPVPRFRESSDRAWRSYKDVMAAETSGDASALSCRTLAAMNARPSSSGSCSSPLGRYWHEVQAHEELAAGAAGHRLETPSNAACEQYDAADEWQPTTTTPAGSPLVYPHGSSPPPSSSPPAHGLGSAAGSRRSPAAELTEVLGIIESPEWQAVPSEEQAKHMHKATVLKRRIQSEDSPRESKSARVRKRDHVHVKKD